MCFLLRLPSQTRPLLLMVIALMLSGCGGDSSRDLSEADYDRAKAALEKALNAWKSGENPVNWIRKNVPVRFVDDAWRKGNILVEYEIIELRANVDNAPEAIVKLKLRSRDGKESEREALYGINLKLDHQIAIGRDPMY